MISYLHGFVKLKEENFVVVENSGIGYKVFVPSELIIKVKIGDEIELYTYQHVREDALQLFGFRSYEELKMFELLISVSGIGPKTALNVFSAASTADIKSAIMSGDPAILKKASGIGGKTAERIVLELRNKVAGIIGVDGIKSKEQLTDNAEVLEALISLGYSDWQAREAIKKISSEIKDVGEMVREALRILK